MHSTKLLIERYSHSITAIDKDKMIIIGGVNNSGFVNNIELVNTRKTNNNDAIIKLPDIEQPRYNHSSVIFNNYIYIIGGCGDLSVHRLDISQINTSSSSSSSSSSLRNKSWETNVIPDIDRIRINAAAVVYDEYIYLFGGENQLQDRNNRRNRDILSSCIRYKPPQLSASDSSSNQSWEPISAMKKKRLFFAAVENGGRIYIIGGLGGYGHFLDSMEIYNPSSNTFEDGPRLPIGLCCMTAVSIGNYIVVNGRMTKNDTATFLFDTYNQQWKTVHSPSINTLRSDHAATVLHNNKIIICGGMNNDGDPLNSIEYILFDELLYGRRWDRRKEFILLRSLVERGRASSVTVSRKRIRKAKNKKKKVYQHSWFQYLIEKSDDDIFRMVLRFL